MHKEIDEPELHAAIKNLLSRKNKVTLLQIGANDGLSYDPIHDLLVSDSDIKAYLVEPQKEAFIRLQHTYKDLIASKKVTTFNVAIHHESAEVKLYKNIIGNDGHSSLLLRQNDSYTEFSEEVYEIVPAISLERLIATINQNIDVLVMDTEGYDATIIESMQTLDCRPELIFFEKPNPNENNDRLNKISTGVFVLKKCLKILEECGYESKVLTGNVIAFKTKK